LSQQTIELDSGILCRALTADGSVRIVAVLAEEAAAELIRAHGLSGDAAAIATEGLVATVLMSAHIKGEERMTIQIQSSAPELSFFAEIASDGAVRGRLRPDFVRAPDRKLNGILLAIKSNDDRELYRGATEVNAETVTEALRAHLTDSVQIEGLLWTDNAAGILLERLPEADGSHALTIAEFTARFSPLKERPAHEVVEAILAGKLGDTEVVVLAVRSVFWQCRCSEERVLGMLGALDAETLKEMIEDDGGAEVICHFCNHPYAVGVDYLRELLADA
jgi:molecular chaperone Hsp33